MRMPFVAITMLVVEHGHVRLYLTPDGNDDWIFDLHVSMRFSDGTTDNFMWRGIRLDKAIPNEC